MTIPSFIGIGGERCGSTWMFEMLKQHPQIYMPLKRKEINFFNKHYDRGFEWYESFFPDSENQKKYSIIGEFTPSYLYSAVAAERIAKTAEIKKIIVILRNPIARLYSDYGQTVRIQGATQTFEEFIKKESRAVEYGFYGKYLEKYLARFDRDSICHFIFEDAVKDLDSTKATLANFLEVDIKEFPETAGSKKVNETYIPKFKTINQIADRIRCKLIRSNNDWAINLAKQLGVQKILKIGAKKKLPPMSETTRQRLLEMYKPDIEKLEKILDINLERWKSR